MFIMCFPFCRCYSSAGSAISFDFSFNNSALEIVRIRVFAICLSIHVQRSVMSCVTSWQPLYSDYPRAARIINRWLYRGDRIPSRENHVNYWSPFLRIFQYVLYFIKFCFLCISIHWGRKKLFGAKICQNFFLYNLVYEIAQDIWSPTSYSIQSYLHFPQNGDNAIRNVICTIKRESKTRRIHLFRSLLSSTLSNGIERRVCINRDSAFHGCFLPKDCMVFSSWIMHLWQSREMGRPRTRSFS